MDLSTLDAMIQCLGRVNRRGRHAAEVLVVADARLLKKLAEQLARFEDKARKPAAKQQHRRDAAQAKLRKLEADPTARPSAIEKAEAALERAQDKLDELIAEAQALRPPGDAGPLTRTAAILEHQTDGSPAALRALAQANAADAFATRASPAPLRPETVTALSLTAADAAPPIETLLHGLRDEPEVPDVHLCWRRDAALLCALGPAAAADALALFRPEPREIARVPLRTAEDLLKAAAERLGELALILRDARGNVTIETLVAGVEPPARLAYATVILPCEAGGLRDGLPEKQAKTTIDDVGDDATRTRIAPGDALPDWAAGATLLRFPLPSSSEQDEAEDADPAELIYAVRHYDPTLIGEDTDITRLAPTPQSLAEHSHRVAAAAARIGRALDLGDALIAALETAGRGHDQGKRQRLWQRAAGVADDHEPMAKARQGRFRPGLLGGYRHEFGSLIDAERHTDDALALHLIAAHHGWARPGFPAPRQWSRQLPETLAAETARRAAERFGRLQARFGPWQLAWLEALLKAADARVSADRDLDEHTRPDGPTTPEPSDALAD